MRTLKIAAAIFFAAITGAHAAEPIKALLLTGGCCHDYEAQKKILTEGISARANVVWTIMYEGGSSRGGVIRDHQMNIYAKDDWAKGFDVVVHDECFGDVTNADVVNHISKAHFDGVPAVILHCSVHSYRKSFTDEWRKCIGISSYSHEGARKFSITNVAPENPIMKGFPAVWQDPSKDEQYRVFKQWPDCIPLGQAGSNTNTVNTVIWANTYGKARVFGTTLGHDNVTVASDTYLDLVTRGLLWACGKLDKDGKPEDGYGPASGK